MEKMSTLPNETIHVTPKYVYTSMTIKIRWCLLLSPLYQWILAMTLSSTTPPQKSYKFSGLNHT